MRRLAVLVLLLAACSGEQTVALVGDSNIASRPAAMENGFTGHPLDTRAHIGAGIRSGSCPLCTPHDWSADLDDLTATAVVIDLGINDAAFAGTPSTQGWADYSGKVDWLMGLLPDVPVYWSNLPCDLEPPEWQDGCSRVNAALDDAESRHPNLTIVDWSAEATADDFLPGDVHLTYEGAKRWAELMAQHLNE